MKKFGYLLFLGAFLCICLLPLIGLAVFGPAPAAANEILSQPPALHTRDGTLNENVLKEASDYLADHFWPRQTLITANARLEAGLLGVSACDSVLLGRDGWLFYRETLEDFQGQRPMTRRQLWAAAHTLGLIRDYADGLGARTVFLIAPNKNDIYPEHMPAWAVQSGEASNADLLSAALEAEGVEHVDLQTPLLAGKTTAQLYQSWDSHWNNLGAALARDAIAAHLGLPGTAFRPGEFVARLDHTPDLYTMLYPAGGGLDWQYYPKEPFRFEYARAIRSAEDHMIRTRCATGEGKLFMFRDSFGNTLHRFLAEDFASASFCRAMPYDLRLVQEGTDVLLLEITHRHLLWLAQRPPVLPAPERALQTDGAAPGAEILLTQSEADGLWKLSGSLGTDPDVDSPVYLEADGRIFEASPVGEMPDSFTAYLTAPVGSAQVLWYRDGILVSAPGTIVEKETTP